MESDSALAAKSHPCLRSRVAENADGKFIVLENDGIGGRVIKGDRWEPHFSRIIEGLPLEGTVALDIGANIGCNSVVLAKALGLTGVLVAFEPQRIPYQQLCGNIVLNGLFNVVAYNNAVGDEDGKIVELDAVDYFAPFVNIGDTKIGRGGDRVEMRSIDSLNITNLSFMKIDVQGSELAVLRGAANTIMRERPLIFIEIEEVQCAKFSYSGVEIIKTLLQMEYALIHIKNDYPVDYLCVPREKGAENFLHLIDGEFEQITN